MNKSVRKILVSTSALLLISGIGMSSLSKVNASRKHYRPRVSRNYSNKKYKNVMSYVNYAKHYDYTHTHKLNSWKIRHINKYLTKLSKWQKKNIINSVKKLNKIHHKVNRKHHNHKHRANKNKHTTKDISAKAKKLHKKLLRKAFNKKSKDKDQVNNDNSSVNSNTTTNNTSNNINSNKHYSFSDTSNPKSVLSNNTPSDYEFAQTDPRVKEGLVTKKEDANIHHILNAENASDGTSLVHSPVTSVGIDKISDDDYMYNINHANGEVEQATAFGNSNNTAKSISNFKKYFANDPKDEKKYVINESSIEDYNVGSSPSDFNNFND